MEPSGSSNPIFYVLGKAPGEVEDERGRQFEGKGGELLKSAFQERFFEKYMRSNNTIRCHPEDNREPEVNETECCRGYVKEDIEASKPLVIIGLGEQALNWVTKLSGITKWRGRLIPVKVGSHVCWFFGMFDPAFVLRKRNRRGDPTYFDFVFERDVELVKQFVENGYYDPPYFEGDVFAGIETVEGVSNTDLDQVAYALGQLRHEPYIGFDIETVNLRPYEANSRILTMAFGTYEHTIAFPYNHPDAWNTTQRRQLRGLVLDFMVESGRKICQNLSFEQEWMAMEFGDSLLRRTEWEDTMAQAHTLDERKGTHNLGVLTHAAYGFNLKEKSNVDTSNTLGCPLPKLLTYNGGDAKWEYRLFTHYRPLIEAEPAYISEYERKIRLCPTLVRAQIRGVVPDFDEAFKLRKEFSDLQATAEAKINATPEVQKYVTRYGQFSATNTDHVLKLMKDVLARPEIEKEEGGWTTDESALSIMPAHEVPSAPLILEVRGLSKLNSTYVDPICCHIDRTIKARPIVHADRLIHTNYNSMEADTGRLSSDDPNLQNFPKRKHKKVRGVIRTPDGQYWMVSADYGQIEFRVIGMASEDPKLVKYMWTDYDVHMFWTKRTMEIYPNWFDEWIIPEFSQSTDDEKKIWKLGRNEIKNNWVFAQCFGSVPESCATNLHLPEWVTKQLAEEFWDEFAGVKKWQERLIKGYERNLYVETLTGRRRRGVLSRNQIINTPIQGTAADIVNKGMCELSEQSEVLDWEELQATMQIHDDLTFYFGDQNLERTIDHVGVTMCTVEFPFINVPLLVEIAVGKKWDKQDELGVWRSDRLESRPLAL
jgi:DNA polymerase-1